VIIILIEISIVAILAVGIYFIIPKRFSVPKLKLSTLSNSQKELIKRKITHMHHTSFEEFCTELFKLLGYKVVFLLKKIMQGEQRNFSKLKQDFSCYILHS
jgi:hypothetical protein